MTLGLIATLLLGCTSTKSEIPQSGTIPIPVRPRPPVEQQLSPGASHTAVQGCLAVQSESEASRFPVPPPTRSAPPPVTVTAVPGGILVVHELAHACCLKSEVATRVEGESVVVSERLTGTPCRCMCSSTLRTSVGLLPGRWSVALDLDRGRGPERVHAETLIVAPQKESPRP